MRKTSALCSAVAVQAIMYIALGSFGIMSLTNLSYRGFVVAAIWAVIFANIYIWNGVESENIIKMTAICTGAWIVIWTLTEMFVAGIFFNISDSACYVFYGFECLTCFGSVFLFVAKRTGKKSGKKLFIILAMVLAVVGYIVVTAQVIKTIPDYLPGESPLDILSGEATMQSMLDVVTSGVSMPRHDMMVKVNAIFYAVESLLLVSLFSGEKALCKNAK